MLRLIQLIDRSTRPSDAAATGATTEPAPQPAARRVALVEEPYVRLIEGFVSIYALAQAAIASGLPLAEIVRDTATGERLDYDPIYDGLSSWHLLPPIDYPDEPSRCLVSGTGLTHIGSARDRNAMHEQPAGQATGQATAQAGAISDSMRMFQSGIDGGRPGDGNIGVSPEWFYKGTGVTLRAHGEPLTVPAYAEDGGEEAEIAGVYVIDAAGMPRRIGMAAGNEFSDHRFEKRNYLNLAGSKLRECAIGPELVVDPDFSAVPGEAWIERGRDIIWRKRIASGDAEMSHSLQNLEHHHFKFALHRRPGDVHVHYFGAHSLSFGEGVTLAQDDVMAIRFEGFGRTLRNVVRVEGTSDRLVAVTPLG
jgi:hypothetical protein